jgi:hypothetical protein
MNAKIIVAGLAAITLAGCQPPLTEEQASDISTGLKAIAISIGKRKCITEEERFGLRAINGVLQEHNSEHHVVTWTLPDKICG